MNEELVSAIKDRYKKGESRATIKTALITEGYIEADIDEAVAYIQQEALKNLPGISHIIRWMDVAEKRTANASAKFVGVVLLSCFAVVVAISLFLYFWLDPLGTRSAGRDTARETDFVKIRTALENYHEATGQYPETLASLSPQYLQGVPLDPKSGASYIYKAIDTKNYTFCVSFETKRDQCISSLPEQVVIPEVHPTDVPVEDAPAMQTAPAQSTASGNMSL